MPKKRDLPSISLSMLDLLSGALGAMMILYIAVPKGTQQSKMIVESNQSSEKQILAANLGFRFKGKKVVFILDTSGSMEKEDRIGQVKAGLKFFMTSLPADFEVEFIQFPGPLGETFKPLFGRTRPMEESTKLDIFRHLYTLKPFGPTPTRETLLYALQNYPEISDVVLLTDGAPTVGMTYDPDDIGKILKQVEIINRNQIQISGLGIGRRFLDEPNDPKYQFLYNLAAQNHGFFFGL